MAKTQSASASPTCRHPIRDRTASAAPNRAGGSSSPPPQLRQSRRLMRHIPQETQVLERAADTLLSPHVRHRVVLPAKEEHPQREQPEAKPRDARKAARDSGLAGDQGPQRLERQQRKEQDRAVLLAEHNGCAPEQRPRASMLARDGEEDSERQIQELDVPSVGEVVEEPERHGPEQHREHRSDVRRGGGRPHRGRADQRHRGTQQEQHVAEEQPIGAPELRERAEDQDGVVVVNLPVVAVTVFVQQRVAAQPAARHLHEREEIEGVVQAFEEADLGRVEQGNDGHRRAGGDSAREAAAGSGGQVHCAHTYHRRRPARCQILAP